MKHDYNVAFMWCLMCICGPFIIQYSSMMNSFFLKGYYTEKNWKKLSCCRKMQAFFMLTFVGLIFIIPMLDITLKFEALATFLSLWCCFKKSKKSKNQLRIEVSSYVEKQVRTLFGMNFYEITSFEQ